MPELLALSPAARLELADRLIQSVPPFADTQSEDAWSRELASRIRDIDENPDAWVSVDDVFEAVSESMSSQ